VIDALQTIKTEYNSRKTVCFFVPQYQNFLQAVQFYDWAIFAGLAVIGVVVLIVTTIYDRKQGSSGVANSSEVAMEQSTRA
jgi:hypothetical protein